MCALYRTGAPDTSVDAADSIDATRLEEMVYQTIYGFGSKGCISDEVREQYPHLAYSSVTARYRRLLDMQLIVDTGRRRPGRSGRNQRVMVAAVHWKEETV